MWNIELAWSWSTVSADTREILSNTKRDRPCILLDLGSTEYWQMTNNIIVYHLFAQH